MKKRALTLLEIMIVIFLITLITGTIGYSMRGALDKGRAFRTEQAKEQLNDLLLMCLAEKGDPDAIAKNPLYYLKKSGLAKDPKKLLVDGWNQEFRITVHPNRSEFEILSDALETYNKKQEHSSEKD